MHPDRRNTACTGDGVSRSREQFSTYNLAERRFSTQIDGFRPSRASFEIEAGLRPDGVFVGERDHHGDPLPEFIGARPEDLSGLMAGLLEANDRMRDRIDDYRTTLQSHSGALMPYIEWRPALARNVEVLNDTADLYRYFDATAAAEFLYACVRRTVEQDLPREIDYLARHDEAIRRIMEAVEMADRVAENLVMFIRRNNGTLSKKRREGEFKNLRDDEVILIEGIVADAFAGF